jgi:hypothetical protein
VNDVEMTGRRHQAASITATCRMAHVGGEQLSSYGYYQAPTCQKPVCDQTCTVLGSTHLLHGFNWEVKLKMKVARPRLKVRGTPRDVVDGIKKEYLAAHAWQNSLKRCYGPSPQSVSHLITCEMKPDLCVLFFLSLLPV